MPTDRPDALELIEAVRAFLREEAAPHLEGQRGYLARVAANALAIALRELRDGGQRAGEASHAPRPDRPDGRNDDGDDRRLGRFSQDRAHAFREHAFRRRLSEE